MGDPSGGRVSIRASTLSAPEQLRVSPSHHERKTLFFNVLPESDDLFCCFAYAPRVPFPVPVGGRFRDPAPERCKRTPSSPTCVGAIVVYIYPSPALNNGPRVHITTPFHITTP